MIETFASAFIEAALFTLSEDETGVTLHPDTDSAMRAFAGDFYTRHKEAVEGYGEGYGYGVKQAGHDLWFTIQGHGVGYWEQVGEPHADTLDAAARRYRGAEELYTGDDGFLHWTPPSST